MSRLNVARNAVILGVFALSCIAAMEYLAFNVGQPMPFSSGYTIHAVFSNADGIPNAADVRASGVLVGKVSAVHADATQPGMTVVDIEINDSHAYPVYTNGFAKVKPKTLLGEKYIDLTVGNPANAEAIPSGGYLPVANTSKDVSNDEIFNAFDAQTRSQEQTVLADLNVATQGRSSDIQSELPNLQKVVDDLAPLSQMYEKDTPQINNIFIQLNTILQTTADEQNQLSGLLSNGNVALAAIAQKDNALIGMLQGFSDVSQELNAAFTPTVQAQIQSLKELGPALSAENQFLDQIVGPHCQGRECGIDGLFTGTLIGRIHYPDDQLTVTSNAGEIDTNEWASMFSQPSNDHRSLNLSLSFHCDTVEQMLQEVFGQILTAQQIQAVNQSCNAVILHGATG